MEAHKQEIDKAPKMHKEADKGLLLAQDKDKTRLDSHLDRLEQERLPQAKDNLEQDNRKHRPEQEQLVQARDNLELVAELKIVPKVKDKEPPRLV
jgi:hypothetical protein